MGGGRGVGRDTPERREFIARPDSGTTAKKKNYAAAFLRENNDPITGGSFTITGYDGWRVGQALYLTDAEISSLDGTVAYEIRQIDTDVNMGNGKLTYTIQFGRPVYSGARHIARRTRRGR